MPVQTILSDLHLRSFLLTHLGRVYSAKAHLTAKIPELSQLTDSEKMRTCLTTLLTDVRQQMIRIELIHTLMDAPLKQQYDESAINIVRNLYHDIIDDTKSYFPELSIIYYLEAMEALEASGFKLMRLAAYKLGNTQIKQLLEENYKNSQQNRVLLMLSATEFLFRKV